MIRLLPYFLIFAFIFSLEGIRISFHDSSTISYKGYHPAHNWTGVSESVKGGIICQDNTLTNCIIKVIVPLESFDSGSSGRDSNMLFHTESNKYPFVKFSSDSFNMRQVLNNESNLRGVLDFHGIQDTVLAHVKIKNNQTTLSGTTQFSVSLDNFNVEKPQLLFIPISSEIDIECNMFCGNDFLNFKDEKK